MDSQNFSSRSPRRVVGEIAKSGRFKKLQRSDPEYNHQVTISVKQKNLDLIHDMLMERSDPTHPYYQRWLSFTEIHELIRNDEAVDAIKSWIEEAGGTVMSTTPHGDYIKAIAPISTWERILNTQFFYWEHSEPVAATSSSRSNLRSNPFHRAEHYSIPIHLDGYISSIFQTTQAPVVARRHGHIRDNFHTNFTGDVASHKIVTNSLTGDSRPSSLNLMYGISSNSGK